MRYFVCFIILFATDTLQAKKVFNSDMANEQYQEQIIELVKNQREYFLKQFELRLQSLQKNFKSQIKFNDDLKTFLLSSELADKKDLNMLLKEHRKLQRDFEKSLKRREKFLAKDLLRPLEKKYENQQKQVLKDLKEQSRQWYSRE